MNRKTYAKICLSCKHFRPIDTLSGKCRVDRSTLPASDYPLMGHQDSCAAWKDAGQQYYIRVGWVKNLRDSEQD